MCSPVNSINIKEEMEPNSSFLEVGAEDDFYFTEFHYLAVYEASQRKGTCRTEGLVNVEAKSALRQQSTWIQQYINGVAQRDECGFDVIMETSPVCEKSVDGNHHTNGLILQKHTITTDVAKAFGNILHPFVIKCQ